MAYTRGRKVLCTDFKEVPLRLAELSRKSTIYELLFSLYLSVVVISAEEMRDFSWSTSLRLSIFSYFNPHAQRPIDDPHRERLIAFWLLWLIVVIIFLCLRFFGRFSLMRGPLEMVGGFVALRGLPAALLYTGFGNRVLLVSQILLSGLCAFLYVSRRWPASDQLNLALLVLYFSFSTWVAWI